MTLITFTRNGIIRWVINAFNCVVLLVPPKPLVQVLRNCPESLLEKNVVVVIASLVCAVNIASRQGFLQYSNSSKD